MKIVLVGFMGSGKSAVGERLSARLGWPLLDVDWRIERDAGMSVSEIFSTKGEDEFRRLEMAMVNKLSREREVVLTTGGGTVINPENVQRLRSESVVFWLRTSPEEVSKRLSGDGLKLRPVLGGDPGRIPELLASREDFYRRAASLAVDTDGKTPDQVADEIIHNLPWPRTVKVELGDRSYPIHIGYTLLARLPEVLRRTTEPRPALLVTSRALESKLGFRIASLLNTAGWKTNIYSLPDGEAAKTLDEVKGIYNAALGIGLGRDGIIFALGGGTVGDAAGFAAATYLRGVDYIQLPTTLVSQIDSSIGGKTGVNLPVGKNLVGAFHQPLAVVADTGSLATLPERERRGGLSEALKHGLLASPALVELLEEKPAEMTSLRGEQIPWMIEENCRVKGAIVAADEREGGQRATLNLGHTIGHALEAAAGYGTYTHGEALSIGLVAACQLSRRLGLLSAGQTERITGILQKLGLPVELPNIPWDTLQVPLAKDKKIKNGKLRFVLLSQQGGRAPGEDANFSAVIRDDVPESLVREVLIGLGAKAD